MTLGAEPKKVMILAGLLVVAVVIYIANSGSGSDSGAAPVPRAAITAPADVAPPPAPTARARSAVTSGEFRPRVPGSRPDDRPDPASINPELRLDLLAKVMAVPPIEAGRNLFQFGAAPPPPGAMPAVPKGVQKIPIGPPHPVVQQTGLKPAGPPPPPSAPPIDLKYYGYKVSQSTGRKEAFLLDGDDIILATENETVKQRYKIVRIALTSIVIEDTRENSTQTLKLQDVPSSS